MKKMFLLALISFIVILSGCTLPGLKKSTSDSFPTGWVGYANGTVVAVTNIKDNQTFTGPMTSAKEKRTGDITIKTDPGPVFTVDYEKYFGVTNSSDTVHLECSPNEIGRRVTIYISNGQPIWVYPSSSDYLDKVFPMKK